MTNKPKRGNFPLVGLGVAIFLIFLFVGNVLPVTVINTGNGGNYTFTLKAQDVNTHVGLTDASFDVGLSGGANFLQCTTGSGGYCIYNNMRLGQYSLDVIGVPPNYCGSSGSIAATINSNQTSYIFYFSPCTTSRNSIAIQPTSPTTISSGNHVAFTVTVTSSSGTKVSSDTVTLCESTCSLGGLGNQTTNSNGVALFNPIFNNAGTHNVYATDSSGGTSVTIVVTVSGTSGPNVITLTPTSATTIAPGSHVSFTAVVKGPGGNFLTGDNVTLCQTLTCSGGGIGSKLTDSSGTALFNPAFTTSGIHNVYARDSSGAQSSPVAITVTGTVTSSSTHVTSSASTTTITTAQTTTSTSTGLATTQTTTTVVNSTTTATLSSTSGGGGALSSPISIGGAILGIIVSVSGFLLPPFKRK